MNELIGKKFEIVYADPGWKYRDKARAGKRGAEQKYTVMPVQDICDLPVKDITADNAALFMWVTWPFIFEAEKVIDAWGFKYKTLAFMWVKRNKKDFNWKTGMGHWTRSNSEPCLLAFKGKMKRASAGVSQIVDAPFEWHSKKPDIVRDSIIKLMGDLPRVELFARERAPGWESWGNEVDT